MKTYASGKGILPRAGHNISYLFGALSDMLVDSFVQDVTNCMDKRQNTR